MYTGYSKQCCCPIIAVHDQETLDSSGYEVMVYPGREEKDLQVPESPPFSAPPARYEVMPTVPGTLNAVIQTKSL